MKAIIFNAQAKKDVTKCPKTIRARIAALIEMLASGLTLGAKDFKPMTSVGSGVYELRVRGRLQYRVFYVAKFEEAIYILHAFNKKTQKTNQKDIEVGKIRYKQLLQERGKQSWQNKKNGKEAAAIFLKMSVFQKAKRRSCNYALP